METQLDNDKYKNQSQSIADGIGVLLLIGGIIFFFSSIIYSFTEADSEKWFSRVLASLICFGFAGIIYRLRK